MVLRNYSQFFQVLSILQSVQNWWEINWFNISWLATFTKTALTVRETIMKPGPLFFKTEFTNRFISRSVMWITIKAKHWLKQKCTQGTMFINASLGYFILRDLFQIRFLHEKIFGDNSQSETFLLPCKPTTVLPCVCFHSTFHTDTLPQTEFWNISSLPYWWKLS